jgi:PIN domain nuclease of toxin-antitoxin system
VKYLLDTHVLIWIASEPARVPEPTRLLLADRRNELLVSAISVFEIATKHRIGKLPGGQRIVADFENQLERLGAKELPIRARHGLIAGQLEWHNRDPFDRLLAAQGIAEDVELVTSDAAFGSVEGLRTVW